MKRLYARIDALRSVRDTKILKRRTRWRIKQRLAKLELKLYNVINDLHNQTSSFLSRNYETIFLPSFSTSEMLSGKCLHSSTKRKMQGFAHYRFKCKLQCLCDKHGSRLFIVDESYTTKTCGNCGKECDVGGATLFSCPCGYNMDRDVHGARNIWIKTMCEKALR